MSAMNVSSRAPILLLAVLLLAAGCGERERARLFRAERLLYQAARAESRARLATARPDSATLMELRGEFLKVRRSIPGPYPAATDTGALQTSKEILRAVAAGEANGARLAIEARRADLALKAATQLVADAGQDSTTARQAIFMELAGYQGLRRFDDAIATMKEILNRYPPGTPPDDGEDPILALPETIVSLKRNLGDETGATREQRAALEYYEAQLNRPMAPVLEAHLRARLLRTALELDMPGKAYAQADDLERLVSANPSLGSMMAGVAFAKGKMRAAMDRDPSEGAAMLERIGVEYPESPMAPRALFEAGSEFEKKGRLSQARERYEAVLQRYPSASDVAPMAMYRLATVQDKMGDWAAAKTTFENLPVRFPGSRLAVEAPMSVIQHYARENRRTAARQYFPRALDDYRGMLTRDSTGRYAPLIRLKMFQIYKADRDSTGLYGLMDEMLRRDPRHPITAGALLEVSKDAESFGNRSRAIGYLRRFLQDFPKSPLAADVRRRLKSLGG